VAILAYFERSPDRLAVVRDGVVLSELRCLPIRSVGLASWTGMKVKHAG